MNVDDLKRQTGYYAVETYVESGMSLGLGTGSTMAHALARLGEHLSAGRLTGIVGVPTSARTAAAAQRAGIPLSTLEQTPRLDLYIDGADEVDPDLNLIKGLGGALLREKIVAYASDRFVVIVDESKQVDQLGSKSALPVEVLPFGWTVHRDWLLKQGCEPVIRRTPNGEVYKTDSGNYIYDCKFRAGIQDPASIEMTFNNRPGIVENGLFLGVASEIVIATRSAGIQIRKR